MTAQQQSVYLCYTAADREFAERFAAGLTDYGFRVWWRWTASEVPATESRMPEADCIVVLWSSPAQKEKAIQEGIAFALARKKRLIPVRIEDIPSPSQFLGIQQLKLIDWMGDPKDPGFLEVVAAVGGVTDLRPSEATQTRVVKGFQRQVVQRAERLFQENLRAESKLDYVELEQTTFYDQVRWNLNSGMNILLGRNGYGKTYLLRGILALLQYEDDVAAQTLAKGSGTISLLRNGDEDRTIRFEKEYFDEEDAVGKLPVLAIPDIRFVNRSSTVLTPIIAEKSDSDLGDLAANGAWHFLRERPYDSMIQSLLYGLCLDYWENGRQFTGEQFDLIRGVVRELTDQSFEFDRVIRDREKFTLYVRTEGNESNPLPIQKASQGTLSAVAMFGLIYDFLKSLRQQSGEVLKRSGIVVIDEVDAHLHPYWQQKIVSLLRGRFPRVQFIMTAHNPIVVAGCLEDEVAVLRKNTERGFSLVQFPNDFIGWQPEEIYRRVFDIENPDETFTRYDALRPFKGQLEEQAAELAKRVVRSPDEERSLEEVEENLLYIEKVEQTRSRRISQEELERENRMLRDRILGLESAHESAARAQRELEATQQTAAREREWLEHRVRDAQRELEATQQTAAREREWLEHRAQDVQRELEAKQQTAAQEREWLEHTARGTLRRLQNLAIASCIMLAIVLVALAKILWR
jgi:AAA domain, putative AbiEii toxin, Type IV TA system/TIR domain